MVVMGHWGKYAHKVKARGYEPLPIVPGQKFPGEKGWQQGEPEGGWRPTQRGYRLDNCGIGILARYTPAVDIDVRNAELAAQIEWWVREALGDAPKRVGQPPKLLMPFRLDGPTFAKMKIMWPVEGQEYPDGVEILADGQQFVAIAEHPGTGKPYSWDRFPHHDDLPPLDEKRARAFLRVVKRRLEAQGLKVNATKLEPASTAPRPPVLPPKYDGTDPWWRVYTPKQIAELVSGKDAVLASGTWRCKCPVHNGQRNDSLAIMQGRSGLLFKCFSECNYTDITRTIGRLVDTVDLIREPIR